MTLSAPFSQMVILNTDVYQVLQMYKSRYIAIYKIKIPGIKGEIFTFYPTPSLVTSLVKINSTYLKFITTPFITSISSAASVFLGQTQSVKYCQGSKYFLF